MERTVTSAPPPRRFRRERFPASIPQPSPISFLPSIENISQVYRLFLSFESSVPCTSVFTFRGPRQWKPGLFSGSSRVRFASGSRSSPSSTFVPRGSCASRGLSCFPQLLGAVGFFAFPLRRQKSTGVDRNQQKSTISPENQPKSAEIDKSLQLSTEVSTLSTGIGAPCKECRGIIGENTRIGT